MSITKAIRRLLAVPECFKAERSNKFDDFLALGRGRTADLVLHLLYILHVWEVMDILYTMYNTLHARHAVHAVRHCTYHSTMGAHSVYIP